MSDYINREDAERFIERHCYPIVHDINSHEQGMTITGIKQALDEIPSADVKPVRHGHWIRQSVHGLFVKCSECGGKSVAESDYCSDCGAKMDGVK